ncbi:MAG: YceH family protein [Methylibium sp.]|uniref:YceH family protein n=1 Tax=Methylibium sp. TaxID=2067992 RepID=UPI0017B28BEC|nr:YceH family protein [Methylibium sp.]MBA3596358.1 YceH family protein [Methylibium sp.]
MRPVSPLELRILGVLVEKQHTVADSYPLSLNTLVLGCNQKTARDPVMNAGEADVLAALDDLKSLDLVIESSGNRVMRYEHNLARVLRVPSQSLAILAVLALRGPQTAAELRAATDRLHRFADVSSVEGFLDELAARLAERGGPLVAKLARGAGAREARWAHLLGGPLPAVGSSDAAAALSVDATAAAEIASLKANQLYLRNEVALLRSQLHRLAAELGVELP